MPWKLIAFIVVIAILCIGAIVLGLRTKRPQDKPISSPEEQSLIVMEATAAPDGSRPYAGIAGMIRKAQDEGSLRLFACACAEHALKKAEMTDQKLLDAIEVCRSAASGESPPGRLEEMRAAVQQIADSLDEKEGQTQEAYENGRATEEEHDRAFAQARAASSVLGCLDDSPREAAADSSYEALTGTDDVDGITKLAQEILR